MDHIRMRQGKKSTKAKTWRIQQLDREEKKIDEEEINVIARSTKWL